MTLLLLFLWVSGAFVAQLVVLTLVVVRQTKRAEQSKRLAPSSYAVALPLDRPDSKALSAWQGLRDFRVTRREFEDTARSQCSFYLQPTDGQALPPFVAGQYLTFQLSESKVSSVAMLAGGVVVRCYTLSCAPSATEYRVTIKRSPPPVLRPDAPPGVLSAYFLDRVVVGDVVAARAPAGRFRLDPASSAPAVLIAGGIGITPLLSMLEWCCARQSARRIDLFYGVRNGADHAFKARLETLLQANQNLRVHTAYAEPTVDDVAQAGYQHTGFIDVDLLKQTLAHERHEFYVCGPSPMMESLIPAIAAWGVPPTDIHFEAFGPATVRLPQANGASPLSNRDAVVSIQFRRSHRTVAWDGRDETLLDFAERHAIVIDAGCRTGSCGSCQSALIGGQVRYASPPGFDVQNGCCLPCVAIPKSSLVLEA